VPTFLQQSQVNTFENTAYKHQDVVTTIVESVQEAYTSYEINIYNKKTEARWVISRRYNEFVALQARLKGTGARVPEDLPPKAAFFASQETVVKTRRLALERWLNLVVATVDPMVNPYLVVFLEFYRQSEVLAGDALGKLGRKFTSRVVDSSFTNERIPPPDGRGEEPVIDVKGKLITVNRLSVGHITLGQGAKKFPHLSGCPLNTNLMLRGTGGGGGPGSPNGGGGGGGGGRGTGGGGSPHSPGAGDGGGGGRK
jgi:hypothetical protein